MKRLMSALLALSLLGTSAAYADSYGRRDYNGYARQGNYQGQVYSNGYGDRGWDRGQNYRGDRGWNRGDGWNRDRDYRDRDYRDRRDHDDGNGAAVAAGVGLFALMAIMASQDRD